MNRIAEERFSPAAGQAFRKLKRLIRYHEFEKRDGGFMQRAIAPDGRITTGDELHRLIIEDYAQIHNTVPGGWRVPFPILRVT
jgi:hypothetical protein